MDDNTLEMERFTATGEGAAVVSTPQCVGCKYNMGRMDCEALAQKPTEYLMNLEECPMKEQR